MTPLGIGIIGAGVVGAMRARTVLRNVATRLCGVADIDLARARNLAGHTGAKTVTDYCMLLDDPDIGAVMISTPVQCHEEMTLAALRARRHVMCEKPLSNTVESCRRMIDEAAGRDRVLAVGFNHRYYPCFRFLKRLLDEGRLGTIDHVRAFAGHEGLSQFRAPWMYERATLGGGAMMDVGIHVADLIHHLGFHVVEVSAVVTNGVWNVPGSEDNAVVIARTGEGVPIAYQATWSEWKGYRLRLEVYGRAGMALAHYPPLLNFTVQRDATNGRRRRRWELYPALNIRERLFGWRATAEAAFAAELDDFLRSIEGIRGSGARGEDGLHAVRFACAAAESSSSGAPVRISG